MHPARLHYFTLFLSYSECREPSVPYTVLTSIYQSMLIQKTDPNENCS